MMLLMCVDMEASVPALCGDRVGERVLSLDGPGPVHGRYAPIPFFSISPISSASVKYLHDW